MDFLPIPCYTVVSYLAFFPLPQIALSKFLGLFSHRLLQESIFLQEALHLSELFYIQLFLKFFEQQDRKCCRWLCPFFKSCDRLFLYFCWNISRWRRPESWYDLNAKPFFCSSLFITTRFESIWTYGNFCHFLTIKLNNFLSSCKIHRQYSFQAIKLAITNSPFGMFDQL